jgi:hypothetical protein
VKEDSMEEYAREHGSSRTEVRADGSVAKFSDPVEGFEVESPLVGEHGTAVAPDGQGDPSEPVGDEDEDEAPEGQEENA